jgi:hypothetical protein
MGYWKKILYLDLIIFIFVTGYTKDGVTNVKILTTKLED